MPQMNEGRYENWAARVLQVKGPGTLTFLEGSLFGMVPLDTAAPVEFWTDQRIDRFIVSNAVAAVAGEFSGQQIRNITDDQLYIIERVMHRPLANSEFFFSFGPVSANFFGTPLLAKALDGRIPRFNTFVPGTLGSNPSNIVLGTEIVYRGRAVTSTETVLEFPCVVPPGFAFTVVNQTANQGIQLNIEFHTRSFVP